MTTQHFVVEEWNGESDDWHDVEAVEAFDTLNAASEWCMRQSPVSRKGRKMSPYEAYTIKMFRGGEGLCGRYYADGTNK